MKRQNKYLTIIGMSLFLAGCPYNLQENKTNTRTLPVVHEIRKFSEEDCDISYFKDKDGIHKNIVISYFRDGTYNYYIDTTNDGLANLSLSGVEIKKGRFVQTWNNKIREGIIINLEGLVDGDYGCQPGE